jgi:hypothetical protein
VAKNGDDDPPLVTEEKCFTVAAPLMPMLDRKINVVHILFYRPPLSTNVEGGKKIQPSECLPSAMSLCNLPQILSATLNTQLRSLNHGTRNSPEANGSFSKLP